MGSDAGPPRFAAALAKDSDTLTAFQRAAEQAQQQLEAAPSLAFVFVSRHHQPRLAEGLAILTERLGGARLLGCVGESIVGGRQEVETEPAVSLWLAALPAATLRTMQLEFERSPDGGFIVGWPDDLPETWPDSATLLMLGDPFSFPTDALLERLGEDQPHVPVLGGMASGATQPGESRLILNDQIHLQGAVAVLLEDVPVQSVVSQGCRPIGEPLVITRAERNVVYELGGKPALLQLKEIFDTLPTHEQEMVQQGLHLGRVVNEYQETFAPGDFLIRNVMGISGDEGSMQVGDYMRAGQTVQFHIRDQRSADQELRQLLATHRDSQPAAALLFTCNGRGTRMFDTPHHDATVISEQLEDLPLAGFFAAGEIGPIGGRNFVHGFTASVCLFGRSQDD